MTAIIMYNLVDLCSHGFAPRKRKFAKRPLILSLES